MRCVDQRWHGGDRQVVEVMGCMGHVVEVLGCVVYMVEVGCVAVVVAVSRSALTWWRSASYGGYGLCGSWCGSFGMCGSYGRDGLCGGGVVAVSGFG
nr:hypothetical protein CFP56_15949 [Quercus suber]